MAIFHLRAKIISRGKGKSAVAAAAYRSGQELEDKQQNMVFDYSHKQGVAHSEILAPDNAPDWAKDRNTLWNAVEASEKRINSQVAREIEIAIPVELTKSQKVELVRKFVQDQFVSQGMIADINIHLDNPGNPHAHILLTTREISQEGFTTKNRTWNQKENLLLWRKEWAEVANQHLRLAGYDVAIDHRSYEDQGLDINPTFHLGYKLHGALKTGDIKNYDRIREYQNIVSKNAENIINEPTIALNALTKQQSVFSEIDIAKFANRNSKDAEQFEQVVNAIKGSDKIIPIAQTDNGRIIYTTREMIDLEASLIQSALTLNDRSTHVVSDKYKNQALHGKWWENLMPTAKDKLTLNDGQLRSLDHVLGADNLSVVIGYAGTGKSTMLGVAKEAWEAQGYRVLGVALSGIAAQNLQDSGIQSRTIDSLMMSLGKSVTLNNKDVIVVDEAGMVDSRRLGKLLTQAEAANAKVVLMGDPEQLQPIQAGAPFRAIAERVGYIEIDEIVRQRDPLSQERTSEMRQASKEFATQKTAEALDRYNKLGNLYVHKTKDEAIDSVVASWDRDRNVKNAPSQIMLAYTRKDVATLNAKARSILIASGTLKDERTLTVKNREGESLEKAFAVNDRIYFTSNDKELGVKNGSLGTIQRIQGSELSVLLDNKTTVVFSLNDYAHIDHGYAATIHKSQGVTVDKTYFLADKYLDRHATYVAATRHRSLLEIHYDKETFANQQELYGTLSRSKGKDMVMDYADVRNLDVTFAGNSAKDAILKKINQSPDDCITETAKTYIERMANLKRMENGDNSQLAAYAKGAIREFAKEVSSDKNLMNYFKQHYPDFTRKFIKSISKDKKITRDIEIDIE